MDVRASYSPTSESGVYFRDQPIIADTTDVRGEALKVSLRAVVLPKTYVEPTEDEGLEYLLHVNDELASTPSLILPENFAESGEGERSPLVKLLEALPDDIRTHLRIRDENCLNFVRKNIPFHNPEEGKQPNKYLTVSYGLLTDEKIDEARKEGEIDVEWYDSTFSSPNLRKNGIGQMWDIRILLDENGLPKREKMDIWIESRVTRTYYPYKFRFEGFYHDPEQLSEVIDFIYNNFSEPTSFVVLPDIREEVLEQGACNGALALHKKVQEYQEEKKQRERQMETTKRGIEEVRNRLSQSRFKGRNGR